MDKARIITLKREEVSTREISRRTGMSCETIAKYWRRFVELNDKLKETPELKEEIQDEMPSKPPRVFQERGQDTMKLMSVKFSKPSDIYLFKREGVDTLPIPRWMY